MSKMSDAFLPFLLSSTDTLPAEGSDERSVQPKQCDSIYILSWPNRHKCIFICFIFWWRCESWALLAGCFRARGQI